jgi:hypothetical protein
MRAAEGRPPWDGARVAYASTGGAKSEHVVKWSVYIVQGQSPLPGIKAFRRVGGGRANPPTITVVFVAGSEPVGAELDGKSLEDPRGRVGAAARAPGRPSTTGTACHEHDGTSDTPWRGAPHDESLA